MENSHDLENYLSSSVGLGPGPGTVLIVEQYAHHVLDFSSQYGSDSSFSYIAGNCIGKPTKFPAYGDFVDTFASREYGTWWKTCPSGKVQRRPLCSQNSCEKHDNFIDLKFQHEVYVHAVYIYETFHPGSVLSLWGGNCRGRWVCLWRNDPCPGKTRTNMPASEEKLSHQPRAFSPQINSTKFPILMIRLILSQSKMTYYSEIDSVALLGSPSTSESEDTAKQSVHQRKLFLKGSIMENVLSQQICGMNVGSVVKDVPRVQHEGARAPEEVGKSAEKPNRLLCVDMNQTGHLVSAGKGQGSKEEETSSSSSDNNSNSGNPFNCLPKETLLHLFSYHDVVTLTRCGQVCQLFRVVARDTQLYARLCFKSLFHLVSDACLKSLISAKCCSHLTQLDLSWCGNYGKVSPVVLQQFVQKCGLMLQQLRLNNCHSATGVVLQQISWTCQSLTELSLSNCHLLESSDFNPLCLLRSLKHLNLYRTKVGQRQLSDILRANRSLLTLNVSSCPQVNGDDLCLLLAQVNPSVLALELFRVTGLSFRGVLALSQLAQLQELDLGWCSYIDSSNGCLVQLIERCPQLRKLFLTAHRQTSDRELFALSHLDHLTQLDVMGTRHVTVHALRHLLQRSPKLTLLDVGYCEKVDDHHGMTIAQLRKEFPGCHIVASSSFT